MPAMYLLCTRDMVVNKMGMVPVFLEFTIGNMDIKPKIAQVTTAVLSAFKVHVEGTT